MISRSKPFKSSFFINAIAKARNFGLKIESSKNF